ncbi:MAG: glycosyltransferase family 4 protein [Acidimicrobiales bacterium]
MRVLFINENIGGHATVHHHLRIALAASPQVEATFIDLPPVAGLARVAGVRVPGLAALDLDMQPLRAELARSMVLAQTLRKHDLKSQEHRPDAIHLYTHNAGLLSVPTWRRIPTVVSLDTTNAQNAYRLPGRLPTGFTPLTVAATKPFERRVYEAATTVVANSDWAARSLREDYGVVNDGLRVQPFGITAPDFGPGCAPGVSGLGKPRAVFVGRSLERKGGLQLLRVHRSELQDRIDLTVVSDEQAPPQPGLEVINDLAPGDGRLWTVLRNSSMFVFPSAIDMAPNAVLEAMMAGLPIIARPVGAIPEMVEHEVNGLLIGPDNRDLVAAINRLIDDVDLRRSMGAASRQRALAHYNALETTPALVEILSQAIDRHAERFGR